MNPTPSLVLVIVALFGCKDVQTASAPWSHSGVNGPASWATNYPECGGSYQSPINILGGFESKGPKPSFNYYTSVPTEMKLRNNGHVLELSGTSAAGKKPYLNINTESGKIRTYELASIHFHWGKVDSEGSEHTFKGRRFAMEMHAVHFRVQDGVIMVPVQIVALAYVYKISANDNAGLAKLLTKIADVKNPATSTIVTPFAWSELIPEFTSDFYLYKGALTVPPCPETANFFIRKKPAGVSSAQMAMFRTLLDVDNNELSGNFRPLQKRNGRNVYYIN